MAHWAPMGSSRRRLAVVVLPDGPVADQLDGLRRAVGDPALERIAPHVTLVPPVNVRAEDLGPALGRLRVAAAAVAGPLRLTLGPPATFLPVNAVLYLQVGGDLPGLRALRYSVSGPPLERPSGRPWVPHVTLANRVPAERITAALAALDRYAVVADVDRVVLLEELAGRKWRPLADAALGPALVLGRGGLEVEVAHGRLVDPEGAAMTAALAAERAGGPPEGLGSRRSPPFPIVVTARREGRIAGVAQAWLAGDGGHVEVLVEPGSRRQGIGTHLLAQVEVAARRAGWECPVLAALGPAGFYQARSAWAVTRILPTSTGTAS